ncbi:MAG TPA: hypothetical protein VMR52_02010 [Dehalococcoidia bacterium]|nr:hypothetical protein [Dehalococcoidia bacterium]
MTVDLVTGGVSDIAEDVGDGAHIEFLNGAAIAADKMMVVLPATGNHIAGRIVFDKDTTDDAELSEEAQRSEDGGPTSPATSRDEVVGGKVALLLQDRRHDRPSRRRHTVSARFQLQ